jgi:hypothetical protein
MKLEPYDQIISLGDWCAPASNIRRKFGLDRAMPFDWWITPYNALINVLTDDFSELFRRDNLEIITKNGMDRLSVMCGHYGILHHHDFRRNAEQKVELDALNDLQSVVEKYRFIVKRLYETCRNRRVLFLRNSMIRELWWEQDGLPYTVPNESEQIDMAVQLYEKLCEKLNPISSDLIVMSNLEYVKCINVSKGTIIFENLGNKIKHEDPFWEANYDNIFEKYEIALRRDF